MKSALKPIFTALLLCATVVGLTRCGKKDDGPKASEQMNPGCAYMQANGMIQGQVSGGACGYPYQNVQGFGMYRGQGSNQYQSGGFGTGIQNLFAGCLQSQAVVYSPVKGLGCVESARLYDGSMTGAPGVPARYVLEPSLNTFILQGPAMHAGFNQYGQQQQYGQQAYYPQNFQSNGSSVLRVCDQAEPCPTNLSCRSPMGPYSGGAIGICYY